MRKDPCFHVDKDIFREHLFSLFLALVSIYLRNPFLFSSPLSLYLFFPSFLHFIKKNLPDTVSVSFFPAKFSLQGYSLTISLCFSFFASSMLLYIDSSL